jgi:hypothetical protein
LLRQIVASHCATLYQVVEGGDLVWENPDVLQTGADGMIAAGLQPACSQVLCRAILQLPGFRFYFISSRFLLKLHRVAV